MKYISLQEVIMFQERLISRFGGSYGIREINLLKSSVENVFQTFEKEELILMIWIKELIFYIH